MLGALKDRLLGVGLGAAFVAAAVFVLPGWRMGLRILVALAILWTWRIARRIAARSASAALARGDTGRAKRLYWGLRLSAAAPSFRRSCRVSLAACAAVEGRYAAALAKIRSERGPMDDALQAVTLNLEAYCLGRLEEELDLALEQVEKAIELRPQVPGFRHTRGMVLLALGRLSRAGRDLEQTWKQDHEHEQLEAERCYDLGRLWEAKGQHAYASDYYERARRAAPESHWGIEAAKLLEGRDGGDELSARQSGVIDALID